VGFFHPDIPNHTQSGIHEVFSPRYLQPQTIWYSWSFIHSDIHNHTHNLGFLKFYSTGYSQPHTIYDSWSFIHPDIHNRTQASIHPDIHNHSQSRIHRVLFTQIFTTTLNLGFMEFYSPGYSQQHTI